jgi:hypothetical protein
MAAARHVVTLLHDGASMAEASLLSSQEAAAASTSFASALMMGGARMEQAAVQVRWAGALRGPRIPSIHAPGPRGVPGTD